MQKTSEVPSLAPITRYQFQKLLGSGSYGESLSPMVVLRYDTCSMPCRGNFFLVVLNAQLTAPVDESFHSHDFLRNIWVADVFLSNANPASKPSGSLPPSFEGVVASFRDADGQEVAVKRVPGHPVTMVCLDDVHVICYNMIWYDAMWYNMM